MLANYFKIALRNLVRNKLYSGLNIIGLAVGMAAALLIGLWVLDEISYNSYHKDYERIAILQKNRTSNGEINTETSNSLPLAAKIRENYGNHFSQVVTSSYGGEKSLKFKETSVIKRGYFMEPGGQEIFRAVLVMTRSPSKAPEKSRWKGTVVTITFARYPRP